MNLSDQTFRLKHESTVNTKLIGGTRVPKYSVHDNVIAQPEWLGWDAHKNKIAMIVQKKVMVRGSLDIPGTVISQLRTVISQLD